MQATRHVDQELAAVSRHGGQCAGLGLGMVRLAAWAACSHAAMASCASRAASTSVSPQAEQPGRSGASAMKPSSSADQKMFSG